MKQKPTINNVCDAFRKANGHNWPDWQPIGMPEPTQVRPGSAEKIAILAERIEQGLELHHPDDFVIEWEAIEIVKCLADIRCRRPSGG